MQKEEAMPKIPTVKLNNGVHMPQLGLGVWQAQEGDEVETAVSAALNAGYRLIDTAAMYGNEAGVGKALKASGIPRSELFVTTKLWNDSHGFGPALDAFDKSLEHLGLDYIDLYLIHWPLPRVGLYVETWKALEQLYEKKRVRAIGVSNFKPEHLEELLKKTTVIPAVDQIELHPKLQQRETRDFCEQHAIRIESYSPLMRGGEILQDLTILSISEKYHKTSAQVILRWHIQHGLIVIPKSVTPERIKENANIFDFKLNDEDMSAIDMLDANIRIAPDPDEAHFR
jgi:diketogulonate reductase-like aldo/keto reductase